MLISLTDYPELSTAHQLLAEFGDTAIIAGGLPRDLLSGKEYGDIDIFIPIASTVHLVASTLRAAEFATKNGLSIGVASYYNANGVEVTRLRLGDNIDLCFMPIYWGGDDAEEPTKLLKSFDFAACQAWLERKGDGFLAHGTQLFYELNERKVLGFYPHKGDLGSPHAMKVLAKYHDYLLLELAEPRKPVEATSDPDNIPF